MSISFIEKQALAQRLGMTLDDTEKIAWYVGVRSEMEKTAINWSALFDEPSRAEQYGKAVSPYGTADYLP